MKNSELVQSNVTPEVKKWLKGEAGKNSRTVNSQIRHYLQLIKSGKIKVEGVGE